MNEEEFRERINRDGYCVVPGLFDAPFVEQMRSELCDAVDADAAYHGGPDYQDYGMVLMCCLYGGSFLDALDSPDFVRPFELMLGEGCIVYSYTSSSMPPGGSNYSRRIHRDCPLYPRDALLRFGGLIMLDDFTPENGATWFLPGSHTQRDAPNDADFRAGAVQVSGRAGSALYMHPRVWHAGGENKTSEWRHATTVGMVPPYMKQRLDIPRLLSGQDLSQASPHVLQKLGFDAQVPTSYDEYYAPASERKFKQRL
jgi:ectoine hydroxylase-related dioxygenase (phytanoyl-CoA dioxygenase family)